MTKSIDVILEGWKNSEHERLGQYFVNRYVGGTYEDLFYCTSTTESINIIECWLHDYNYEYVIPPRADDCFRELQEKIQTLKEELNVKTNVYYATECLYKKEYINKSLMKLRKQIFDAEVELYKAEYNE